MSLLVQRACELVTTLGGAAAGFRDLRHPADVGTASRAGACGTVIQIAFAQPVRRRSGSVQCWGALRFDRDWFARDEANT